MSLEPRQKALLGVLAVLAAIFAWRSLSGSSEPPPQRTARAGDVAAQIDGSSPPARRTRRDRRNTAPRAPQEVIELRIAALDEAGGSYRPGRNPFEFYVAPQPPPPPPPKPEPRPEPIPIERPPQEQVVDTGPRPPRLDYSFIGRFGPKRRPIAVLQNEESILNVRIGDVLDGDFRLVRIGIESVQLEYVNFPDLPARTLRLGGEGS